MVLITNEQGILFYFNSSLVNNIAKYIKYNAQFLECYLFEIKTSTFMCPSVGVNHQKNSVYLILLFSHKMLYFTLIQSDISVFY